MVEWSTLVPEDLKQPVSPEEVERISDRSLLQIEEEIPETLLSALSDLEDELIRRVDQSLASNPEIVNLMVKARTLILNSLKATSQDAKPYTQEEAERIVSEKWGMSLEEIRRSAKTDPNLTLSFGRDVQKILLQDNPLRRREDHSTVREVQKQLEVVLMRLVELRVAVIDRLLARYKQEMGFRISKDDNAYKELSEDEKRRLEKDYYLSWSERLDLKNSLDTSLPYLDGSKSELPVRLKVINRRDDKGKDFWLRESVFIGDFRVQRIISSKRSLWLNDRPFLLPYNLGEYGTDLERAEFTGFFETLITSGQNVPEDVMSDLHLWAILNNVVDFYSVLNSLMSKCMANDMNASMESVKRGDFDVDVRSEHLKDKIEILENDPRNLDPAVAGSDLIGKFERPENHPVDPVFLYMERLSSIRSMLYGVDKKLFDISKFFKNLELPLFLIALMGGIGSEKFETSLQMIPAQWQFLAGLISMINPSFTVDGHPIKDRLALMRVKDLIAPNSNEDSRFLGLDLPQSNQGIRVRNKVPITAKKEEVAHGRFVTFGLLYLPDQSSLNKLLIKDNQNQELVYQEDYRVQKDQNNHYRVVFTDSGQKKVESSGNQFYYVALVDLAESLEDMSGIELSTERLNKVVADLAAAGYLKIAKALEKLISKNPELVSAKDVFKVVRRNSRYHAGKNGVVELVDVGDGRVKLPSPNNQARLEAQCTHFSAIMAYIVNFSRVDENKEATPTRLFTQNFLPLIFGSKAFNLVGHSDTRVYDDDAYQGDATPAVNIFEVLKVFFRDSIEKVREKITEKPLSTLAKKIKDQFKGSEQKKDWTQVEPIMTKESIVSMLKSEIEMIKRIHDEYIEHHEKSIRSKGVAQMPAKIGAIVRELGPFLESLDIKARDAQTIIQIQEFCAEIEEIHRVYLLSVQQESILNTKKKKAVEKLWGNYLPYAMQTAPILGSFPKKLRAIFS